VLSEVGLSGAGEGRVLLAGRLGVLVSLDLPPGTPLTLVGSAAYAPYWLRAIRS